MLEFYDKLFISIYKLYTKQGRAGFPIWISILFLSLFQSINIISALFIYFWFVYGDSFNFIIPAMISVSVLGLIFNYIRIYKIIGVYNLIERYAECTPTPTNPIMYCTISLLLLLVQGV